MFLFTWPSCDEYQAQQNQAQQKRARHKPVGTSDPHAFSEDRAALQRRRSRIREITPGNNLRWIDCLDLKRRPGEECA